MSVLHLIPQAQTPPSLPGRLLTAPFIRTCAAPEHTACHSATEGGLLSEEAGILRLLAASYQKPAHPSRGRNPTQLGGNPRRAPHNPLPSRRMATHPLPPDAAQPKRRSRSRNSSGPGHVEPVAEPEEGRLRGLDVLCGGGTDGEGLQNLTSAVAPRSLSAGRGARAARGRAARRARRARGAQPRRRSPRSPPPPARAWARSPPPRA